jgi:hypothetical protein
VGVKKRSGQKWLAGDSVQFTTPFGYMYWSEKFDNAVAARCSVSYNCARVLMKPCYTLHPAALQECYQTLVQSALCLSPPFVSCWGYLRSGVKILIFATRILIFKFTQHNCIAFPQLRDIFCMYYSPGHDHVFIFGVASVL